MRVRIPPHELKTKNMKTVFKILRDHELGVITEKEKDEWLDIVLNTDYKE